MIYRACLHIYSGTVFFFLELIREKGLQNATVDDLVTEITPKGRALVPEAVKMELLQRIKGFLAKQQVGGV
jgi:hypothetical protein